jgi:hypothetical protein
MSIRNMDADLASNKLNELFHLHRYEDCVLFINRLNHLILKQVLTQLPVDMYLSRLPYTIELFEALYAKMFILDPDNFPVRTLQPERLIDKMIAYFSSLGDQLSQVEPVDGPKLLDSFENVIRIISYIQPNQYSRLLYFKYAIDRALLKFDKDLSNYTKNLANLNEFLLNSLVGAGHGHVSSMSQSNSTTSGPITTSTTGAAMSPSPSTSSGLIEIKTYLTSNYANALLISRASNVQSCETMRMELVKSISNCHKALLKLNDYLANLKSQKLTKNLQTMVFSQSYDQHQQQQQQQSTAGASSTTGTLPKTTTTTTSPKSIMRKSKRNNSVSTDRKTSTLEPSSSSSSNKAAAGATTTTRSESVSNFNRERKANSSTALISASTICQDFIQNRLYLNKAMMNAVEPYLESIKLQQLLNALYEKIDMDKEILLVYTHIKREEGHLNSLEPLQPLFKRYSLGFERCIQIWRKKCSADSLLLFSADPDVTSLTRQQQRSSLVTLAAAQIQSKSVAANNNNNKQEEEELDDEEEKGDEQKFLSEANLLSKLDSSSTQTTNNNNNFNTMPSKLKQTKKLIVSLNRDETAVKSPATNRKSIEIQTESDAELAKLKQELQAAEETIGKLKFNETKMIEK